MAKAKRTTMIDKTLHRTKIQSTRTPQKTEVKSSTPEEYAVADPHVTPSCYSCYKSGDKSWTTKGQHYVLHQWKNPCLSSLMQNWYTTTVSVVGVGSSEKNLWLHCNLLNWSLWSQGVPNNEDLKWRKYWFSYISNNCFLILYGFFLRSIVGTRGRNIKLEERLAFQ